MARRGTASLQPSPDEVYPIRTVASLTGVNPVTLRAWERRYGLIKPIRTPSGHRMYTREQIDRVHHVLGLLEKGAAIGQISRTLTAGRVQAASRTAEAWEQIRTRMLSAITRFDEAALEEAYNEALATYPLDLVTHKLLVPLLVELGRRWESAEGSIVEEHFFSMYVRNKLGARFHHRTALDSGPTLLGACAPGEQHEIGLLLFALAAHEAGVRSVLLGANTPIEQLGVACRRAECDAIVVSCTMTPDLNAFGAAVRALVASAGAPVYCGGSASATHRDAITQAGAIALGPGIEQGVRRIISDLGRIRSI